MNTIPKWKMRAQFAKQLSDLYGAEVPAYKTLTAISDEVNYEVLNKLGSDAERLGGIDRVTAERHGAIRVGTPTELKHVASIFATLGMYPVGFYDLRDAAPSPIPVVSTAFRPVDQEELERNPFRVFVSILVPEDRRFFSEDLEARLLAFLDARKLFPEELLLLAQKSKSEGGLSESDALRFIELAVAAFALSSEPVDREWYNELERISSVAADIGGVSSTHINHLTPRVLDIDELYSRMESHGISMIDDIQGPPRWGGPDVLLRQTSFRALAEPRRLREPDGTVIDGELRVRFGEVESRGIALTPAGLELYEQILLEIERRTVDSLQESRQEVAKAVWSKMFPATMMDLALQDLAYFTFRINDTKTRDSQLPQTLDDLLTQEWILADPIVYEDFLPRSAAGIFSSNLTGNGEVHLSRDGVQRDKEWMENVIGMPIYDPDELYSVQRRKSLEETTTKLGLKEVSLPS